MEIIQTAGKKTSCFSIKGVGRKQQRTVDILYYSSRDRTKRKSNCRVAFDKKEKRGIFSVFSVYYYLCSQKHYIKGHSADILWITLKINQNSISEELPSNFFLKQRITEWSVPGFSNSFYGNSQLPTILLCYMLRCLQLVPTRYRNTFLKKEARQWESHSHQKIKLTCNIQSQPWAILDTELWRYPSPALTYNAKKIFSS